MQQGWPLPYGEKAKATVDDLLIKAIEDDLLVLGMWSERQLTERRIWELVDGHIIPELALLSNRDADDGGQCKASRLTRRQDVDSAESTRWKGRSSLVFRFDMTTCRQQSHHRV